jgi:hypothetical protein
VKATVEQCKCGCKFKPGDAPSVPCLFDVDKDVSEYDDITAGNEEVDRFFISFLSPTESLLFFVFVLFQII